MSANAAAVPVWRVVGASVRGTSHVRTGHPCQDAHAWAELEGGAVAVAAADGAGSAAHAEHGAQAAVRAALEALRQGGAPPASAGEWRERLGAALVAGRAAVEAAAAGMGAETRELATTLLVAVLEPGRVAAAQVGDGAVVAQDGAGAMHALTLPPRAEFANETVFLTMPGAVEGAQTVVWEHPARHLAIFTDGLQGLALRLPAGTPHEPFFTPLFRFAAEAPPAPEAEEALAAFLSGPRVTARADDDLTLLLAARAGWVAGPGE